MWDGGRTVCLNEVSWLTNIVPLVCHTVAFIGRALQLPSRAHLLTFVAFDVANELRAFHLRRRRAAPDTLRECLAP